MKFHVMDYYGHSTIEFEKSQIKEAMEKFYELVSAGYTPAHRDEQGRDYHVSRRFAEADETLFVPQLKGG